WTSPATSPATAAITRWWLAARRTVAGGTKTSGRRLTQHITHPPHGVDQPRLPLGFGLAAQVTDIDFQRVARRGEVEAPRLLENAAAGEHPSWVGDQHFQQREFGTGETDLPLAAGDLAGRRVQGQIGKCQCHRLTGVVAGGAA